MLKFYFDFFLFEGKTKLDDVRHKIFLKLEFSDKFVIFKFLKILWFHNSINIFYASKKIFLENSSISEVNKQEFNFRRPCQFNFKHVDNIFL